VATVVVEAVYDRVSFRGVFVVGLGLSFGLFVVVGDFNDLFLFFQLFVVSLQFFDQFSVFFLAFHVLFFDFLELLELIIFDIVGAGGKLDFH
jgi:hypothetical protein